MHSWVRYSVSVYLGLLLAGSIASPGVAPRRAPPPMASVYQRSVSPPTGQTPLYRSPTQRTERAPARAES